MEKLSFHVNDQLVELTGVSPTTTLLRWLRDSARLTGTKEGCAEGDCGACTVAVLDRDGPRSVCSCLLFLPMVQGRRLYTVEGIGDSRAPHLVQETLARALGSQCGYCTPGVTMSMFEACYRQDLDEPWQLDAQMCGNLCRCTGYRPIRDAAKAVAGACPEDRFLAAARGAASGPGPDLHLSYRAGGQRYYTPATFDELWGILDREPAARFVAGGTDLALEVTKRFAEPEVLVSVEGLAELSTLAEGEAGFSLGAGASLSAVERLSRRGLPSLERMLRYFGSRQIKNRATIGGNLCTASPIGDLAPVFLALGATCVARSRLGERRIPAGAFFTAYRRTALQPGEVLVRVEVPRPPPGARVASYKVSKRRELDISTVSASFFVTTGGDGRVQEARFAYGGMAATPTRASRAEAALLGRPLSEPHLAEAAAAIAEELRPISDHRGSAWYRSKVAANLLLGFFEETDATPAPRLAHGHSATVEVR